MKSEKLIQIFYRGPLERSRLGFLLELFLTTGLKLKLYWLLPHPKFQNENHRVFEPFMEDYPAVEFEIISARFSEVWLIRKKVKKILKNYPEGTTVCIGFTAPFFLPLKKLTTQVWCINGIPEESLLHRNSLLKRMQVGLKWKMIGKLYSPDLVITVSNRMNIYVSQKIPNSKFISIPLCVDLDRFHNKGQESKRYFTYSGSGAPWQNLQQLSEVWGSLFQLDSTIKFRVITRDPRARVLGSQVPNHAIEFVGTSNLDELAGFLKEAEVGFLIRKDSLVNRVSFPTKLSEYLASGAWAVISDIDWDVADMISKYQVGVLVNPTDSSEKIAKEILTKKTTFSQDEDFESRMSLAVAELGKSHWLNLGKKQLIESGYFNPINDSQ